MVDLADNFRLATSAISAHKLRAVLTILGLTMGVATLITVMTIVQGANVYVEQKIANLGTNVFRVSKTPFAVVDFTVFVKALKNKNIYPDDLAAVAERCRACEYVGASASGTLSLQYQNKQVDDTTIFGYTPNMVDIDTRTLDQGRYFTPTEDHHAAYVCLIGASLVDKFFSGVNPVGRNIRTGSQEFTVIGTFEKLGSVLGQDQDNYVVIPLTTYLKVRGTRSTLTLEIKASGGERNFNAAQDEVRVIMRSRRHDAPGKEDELFHRHRAKLHRALAEHQRIVLRGVRDGQFDFGDRGRHCHHERDAGERDRANPRDRRAARAWAPRRPIFCASFSPKA